MRIKHDPDHIDRILFGDKCITARLLVAFDEYKELSEGQRVELTTPGGLVFAEATIDKISVMPVQQFVAERLDGHKTYSNTGHMINDLEGYYPEYKNRIYDTSTVAVIWYRDITMVYNEMSDANIHRLAEYLMFTMHSMPFGGEDWAQQEGFCIPEMITRHNEIAIRRAVE